MQRRAAKPLAGLFPFLIGKVLTLGDYFDRGDKPYETVSIPYR